ncbi:GVQW3 protein, partial [Acromyrmex charruanus]
MQRHDNIKINTVFNSEFVSGDKRANKSVSTRNRFARMVRVACGQYPILTSLEEFQERDSGWTLSRILNLTVNVNKYNPLHAECRIEFARKIKMKSAMINVRSMENVCFAIIQVLNLTDIVFPMMLNKIRKFENQNNISINVYYIEEQKEKKRIFPLRFIDMKRNKHVNLLYVQDSQYGNVGYFAWIKDLSRLVSSQINKYGHKKYFCDKYVCLHYFESSAKLDQILRDDWQKFNSARTELSIIKEKYISFTKYVGSTKNDQKKTCVKVRFIDSFKFLSSSLIFENFRDSCITSYRLDPTYYYILPGFTWDPGYIFEVDLEYLQHDKREEKLLATLYDKKPNIIYYRTLQQYTHYKDPSNYVDVKLLTKWEGRYDVEAMIAKPNFHSRSVFSENLVAETRGEDKPIYVNMCTLDISKTCLYKFHHEHMLPFFHEKYKIITGSETMELPAKNVSTCELRAVIRFLTAKGLNGNEIHTELVHIYGDKCMSVQMVRRWRTYFLEGRGEVHDEQRAGRPKTAITDDAVAAVEKIILADRRFTIDRILDSMPPEIDICRTSIHTIITDHLRYRKVCASQNKNGMCLKTKKKKPMKKRILSVAKCDSILPILLLLGVFGSLVSDAVGVAKTINNNKAKMPKDITTNIQLQQLAKHMCIPYFRGIFMCTLPTEGVYRNESDIVNLNNADGSGTHWVAYAKRGDRAVYFDSFSNLRPLKELMRHLDVTQIEYNRTPYQCYDQSNCKELCLQFLQTIDDQFKN